MQKQNQVPNMLQFIKKESIQKLQHLSIKIEGWEWVYSLDRFLPALAAKHELTSLHIEFKDNLKSAFLGDLTKKYPDSTLHMSLSGLAQIRGVEKVTFAGDLPDVYTKPLVQIMQGTSIAVPTLQAIRGNGTVVDADDADN